MRLTRLLVIPAGFLFALGLAACSGSDDDDTQEDATGGVTVTSARPSPESTAGAGGNTRPPGAEIDACSLLLPEDIEPLIGAAPEPNDDPAGPFATCSYWETSSAFVQFQVCRCLGGDEFDRSLESGAATLGVKLEEVAGLGDKAYWMEGILWVQQGDVVMNLWISRPAYFEADGTALGGDDLEGVALPDAQALALTVLGRIG